MLFSKSKLKKNNLFSKFYSKKCFSIQHAGKLREGLRTAAGLLRSVQGVFLQLGPRARLSRPLRQHAFNQGHQNRQGQPHQEDVCLRQGECVNTGLKVIYIPA